MALSGDKSSKEIEDWSNEVEEATQSHSTDFTVFHRKCSKRVNFSTLTCLTSTTQQNPLPTFLSTRFTHTRCHPPVRPCCLTWQVTSQIRGIIDGTITDFADFDEKLALKERAKQIRQEMEMDGDGEDVESSCSERNIGKTNMKKNETNIRLTVEEAVAKAKIEECTRGFLDLMAGRATGQAAKSSALRHRWQR